MAKSNPVDKKNAKTENGKSFSLISDDTFRRMYAAMLGCRKLEERARRELRSRRKVKQQPIASSSAKPLPFQEALIVGTTVDLRPDDTITAPSGEVVFRSSSKSTAKGKAAQAQQAIVEARRNVIASAASTGAQLTIGTGVALANKDHGTQRVVVSFGDANPDSLGSWNEALHLAGLYHLPILFVLRPVVDSQESQASFAAICERATLAGVITIPVDCVDVVAMYRVSFESIERARKGTGATLIVSTQFVIDGQETKESTDPVKRLEVYLAKKGLFSAKWKAEIVRQLK